MRVDQATSEEVRGAWRSLLALLDSRTTPVPGTTLVLEEGSLALRRPVEPPKDGTSGPWAVETLSQLFEAALAAAEASDAQDLP